MTTRSVIGNETHRFDPARRNKLLTADRWNRWDPPHMLSLSGLREGQRVLDLGCGPGFWTLPIAEIIGSSGYVIALDVSSELLDNLAARNVSAHIHLMRCELPTIDLSDDSVDFIWAAFIVHEVRPVPSLAEEMRRVLRPGGTLAVLDWRPDAESESSHPRHHRISSEEVQSCLVAAGFCDVQSIWQNGDAYLVTAC